MPELQFIENLQKKGEILFKPTREFRDLDDQNPRRDTDENKPLKHEFIPFGQVTTTTDEVVNYGTEEFQVVIDARGTSVETHGLAIEIGGQESVYCFSMLTARNYKSFITNYEWEKLGGYALVIIDIPEFRRRVYTGLEKSGKSHILDGMVSYIPQKFMDNIRAVYNPYIKLLAYQYEFEYRVSCSTSGEQEFVHIGSLEDISEIIPVSDLKSHLQKTLQNQYGEQFA